MPRRADFNIERVGFICGVAAVFGWRRFCSDLGRSADFLLTSLCLFAISLFNKRFDVRLAG